MNSNNFPSLMSPLKVGPCVLANRIIMGAMHTRLESLDQPTQRIAAFYRARAEGEVAMIITGGVSPNPDGRIEEDSSVMSADADRSWHKAIVDSVRGTRTLMCLQLLHAGRYAKFAGCVGPSALKARINRHVPRALTTDEVWDTVADYARAAAMARELGYDAVEIMGSEGYLINQFTAPLTNKRQDEFGGSFEGRVRLPVEVVKAVRRSVGDDFPVIYRISAVDLMDGGMSGDETRLLATLIESAGADALNTGIGWHESGIPTVGQIVPRASFAYAASSIKQAVSIPVIASNRINDPQVAEDLIASGAADLVSMARPLLADPAFARKARLGQAHRINTCIACNQGCLDRIFVSETASCLVNPRAGHETEFDQIPAIRQRRIAVVGGGAAGMAFAVNAARRGHSVRLHESAKQLGGQLLMARAVPDKSEFDDLLRYFREELQALGVEVHLGSKPDAAQLLATGCDAIVVATGVRPRQLIDVPGADHPNVLSYTDVLLHGRPVGQRVAIIGAGGIGFDVAEFLAHGGASEPATPVDYASEFGLDPSVSVPGGLLGKPVPLQSRRKVTLLQRKDERPGTRLAVSTGWIHRDRLKRFGVEMLSGVRYERIDNRGLHVVVAGEPRCIEADTVVVCAGQESERGLYEDLRRVAGETPVYLIGGADQAVELDAMRAIDQATRLADNI